MATINIFGEKFQGLGRDLQISNKFGISLDRARKIISGGTYNNVYFRKGKMVKKIDIRSPLATKQIKDFTGAKRLSKKRFLSGQTIKGNKPFIGGVKGKVSVFVQYSANIKFSREEETRHGITRLETSTDTLDSDLEEYILNKFQIDDSALGNVTRTIYDERNGNTMTLSSDMVLREHTHPDISQIYDIDTRIFKQLDGGDCAKKYMKIMNKRKQKNADKISKWTVDTIGEYVKDIKTKAEIWDVLGNKLLDYTPETQDKNSRKVKAIVHDNHIYPLKKSPDDKKKYKKIRVVADLTHYDKVKGEAYIVDVCPYEKDYLKVKEYIWNSTLHIVNPDYEMVQSILEHYKVKIKNERQIGRAHV